MTVFGRLVPRALVRFVAGVAFITAMTFAGSVYGTATSNDRLDPAVRAAAVEKPYVDVIVRLNFKPQAFHMRQMQARGTVGAATDSSIQLRRVSRADLELLAVTPWIARVELLPQ